jgi:hypothetical protein
VWSGGSAAMGVVRRCQRSRSSATWSRIHARRKAPRSEIEASQVPVAVYYPAIFRPGRGSRGFHPEDPYFRLADIIGDYCHYITEGSASQIGLGVSATSSSVINTRHRSSARPASSWLLKR